MLVKDIDLLEKVQRRAAKMMEEFIGKSYEERLEAVGLTTLENRRIRADLIEVFRIFKGLTRNCSSRGTYLIQGGIA